VGTYPDQNAYATLVKGAKLPGAKSFHTQTGAEVVTYAKTPSSVYFAFPNVSYLMEVFDPSPARALSLVLSGQIKLVG
jgi:hypothetical protein